MKPNKKQIAIARFIEVQSKSWQQTNDIDSPTHYSDMKTDFYKMCEDEGLSTEFDIKELYSAIEILKKIDYALRIIQYIK